jgi:transposase
MTQAAAAKIYKVSVRTISKWMKAARERGLRALRAGKRGRRPESGPLNHRQAVGIRKMTIERMPDPLAPPFDLWTRELVTQLIEREYGTAVSARTAGRYLKVWGTSARRPIQRAYERNDAAIERGLNDDYPQIAKEAKQEQATIDCGGEIGLHSDPISAMSFALKGQTPVVPAIGKRFGCNMISAITNRGALSFMVFEGTFKNATFIDFLKRLLTQATRKIYLIVDGHPVHRSVVIKQFVAAHADRLRLIRLPSYGPAPNSDELLNQDVKTNACGKSRPTHKANVQSHLHRPQKEPHVIRNLFNEKHIRYAA